MTYAPYYPNGWKDEPDLSTPIIAAALQNMESGISAAATNGSTGNWAGAAPGGKITVASSAPSNPSVGDLWIW